MTELELGILLVAIALGGVAVLSAVDYYRRYHDR